MKNIKNFNSYISEKWSEDVEIEKTGEHAGKAIEELENELKSLKIKSERYQKENKPVPKKIKEKESEINFAIRAKRHWK